MAVFDDATQVQTMDWFPGYVMTGSRLVPPAIWVRNHLPADAVIATRRIGVLGYYSGHAIFDYAYGLPDRKVARLVAKHGDRFDLPTDAALAGFGEHVRRTIVGRRFDHRRHLQIWRRRTESVLDPWPELPRDPAVPDWLRCRMGVSGARADDELALFSRSESDSP